MLDRRFEAKLNKRTVALLIIPGLFLLVFVALGTGLAAGSGATAIPHSPEIATPKAELSYQQAYNGEAKAEEDGGSDLGLVIDVLLKLIVVVGLIYATSRGLQYFNRRSRASNGRRALINVIESLNLAQNQVLYLVEVGDKALLVGATGTQLSTLTEITDPAVLANLHAQVEPRGAPPDSFARYLQTFTGQLRAESRATADSRLLPEKLAEATALIRRITSEAKRTAPWLSGPRVTRALVSAEEQGVTSR